MSIRPTRISRRIGAVARPTLALVLVVVLTAGTTGCLEYDPNAGDDAAAATTTDTADDRTLGCGTNGAEVEVDGEPVACIYDKALIIETGFSCPPAVPMMHELEGHIVCGGEDGLNGSTLDAAREAADAGPDALPCTPACGADAACNGANGRCMDTLECGPETCSPGCPFDACRPPPPGYCLDVLPDPLLFGQVTAGSIEAKTVTAVNCGDDDLELLSMEITGSPDFSPRSFPAPVLLTPGESLALELAYAPPTPSPDTAVLTIELEKAVGVKSTVRIDIEGNGNVVEPECPTAVASIAGLPRDGSLPTDIGAAHATVDVAGAVKFFGASSQPGANGDEIVEYRWSVIEAPEGFATAFSPSDDVADPEMQLTLPGDYLFELDVVDTAGRSACAPDRVAATVTSQP